MMVNYTEQYKIQAIELLGGKCAVCGESDIRCLEIDHIIPLRSPRSIQASREALSSKDTSNLQVLCANHHRIKTVEDYKKYPPTRVAPYIPRSTPNRNSTTGYIGVGYSDYFLYFWTIRIGGHTYRRTFFKSAKEAADDRDDALGRIASDQKV